MPSTSCKWDDDVAEIKTLLLLFGYTKTVENTTNGVHVYQMDGKATLHVCTWETNDYIAVINTITTQYFDSVESFINRLVEMYD